MDIRKLLLKPQITNLPMKYNDQKEEEGVIMNADVPIQKGVTDVGDFLFNPKWKRHRIKLENHNCRKTGSHIAKISKNGLKLRNMLLMHHIEIFPVIFRTYEKNNGQGAWSWEVFDDSMMSLGSWQPLTEVIKGESIILAGDEIFSNTK